MLNQPTSLFLSSYVLRFLSSFDYIISILCALCGYYLSIIGEICVICGYFLRNEPNFPLTKMTLNLFLNNTNDDRRTTNDDKTNPIQTQCCHSERSRGIYLNSHPAQRRAGFQPKNPEPNFRAKPPILAHCVCSPKTHIRRSADRISLFLTTKTAKKSNPILAQNTPLTDRPIQPKNAHSKIKAPQIALFNSAKPTKNRTQKTRKTPPTQEKN